jgi:hypothetical protein
LAMLIVGPSVEQLVMLYYLSFLTSFLIPSLTDD